MMLKVDFQSVKDVGKRSKELFRGFYKMSAETGLLGAEFS